MRRKYAIHPSVGMRSPTEFERAPDGGAGEVAVYEAYLEAGFWGVIPSLIGKVSSFFSFCPFQLTPLTWRTLMAIQILYSYHFTLLANKEGFYHLRSRDGAPLVEEPSRGVRGNHPFGEVGTADTYVSRPVSFAGEAVAKLIMGIPRRFRWVTFLVSREALRHSRVWGNTARLPVSVVYDEHQKVKAQKQRFSYTPPPRLARAALSAGGLSSISSTSAEIVPNRDLLVDAHRRLTSEALLLRSQVQDMMARRDLLVQQVRASARWKLKKEWQEKRVEHWNPEEEYQRHLFLSGGFNHRLGSSSQAATPRSVVGSRFSEGPSF
ncbi:hypothetical protein Bca52824_073491 [Brassica carinata]|uniref:Uncharacterized protein n=1 Tax=Brassica carinata TaxID=52824 RepID=A0A8X7QBP1_BRACI|nr:hypothetical protein Bca52824_073491 [Brassica carinata]